MDLRALIECYAKAAGGFGTPVALAQLGLPRDEVERTFSALDEDYHLSRFVHFSTQPGAALFRINGFDHTHVALDAAIQSAL